jgi:hypothetical protein
LRVLLNQPIVAATKDFSDQTGYHEFSGSKINKKPAPNRAMAVKFKQVPLAEP